MVLISLAESSMTKQLLTVKNGDFTEASCLVLIFEHNRESGNK